MVERLKKCYHPECEQQNLKYPSSELQSYKGKNYCKKHIALVIKEGTDRDELIVTIKKMFNIAYPTGLMLKQIKEYHSNGLKYSGMKYTLEYIDAKYPGQTDVKFGVSRIPWYYEEAKEFLASRKNTTYKPFTVEVVELNLNDIEKPIKTIKKYGME